jgi:group I intron endonuclease
MEIMYSIPFNIQWYKEGNDIMRNSGIYIIKNILTDKIYIGSTKCFFRRYQNHRKPLLDNKHNNSHLQNSFNKHGESNFTFNIIEICNKDILIEREQYWLDLLTPYQLDIGFNIANVAGPNMNKGISPTPEQRKKISDTLKLHRYPNARKGVVLSDEIKKKISNSVKARELSGIKLPQSRQVELTNIITGEIELFESMTELHLKYKIDRTTLNKYNKSGKILKETFKVNILNDYTLR